MTKPTIDEQLDNIEAAKNSSDARVRFLDALARDREKRGLHYSTMDDAFRVLTVVLGYKEPDQ